MDRVRFKSSRNCRVDSYGESMCVAEWTGICRSSDVQEIFPCVTEHRIILNMKAKVGHIKKEELIRRVLESVPTPTMRQKY